MATDADFSSLVQRYFFFLLSLSTFLMLIGFCWLIQFISGF